MSEALVTYLRDHLAGAMHAIELLKAMRDHHSGEPHGLFAAELLDEIEADRDVLAALAEKAGSSAGGVKEWIAWLAEKVSRLKLKLGRGDGLGTFEALEFLVLGIHGKWALWRALSVVTECDSRLAGIDFEQLALRAKNQHDKVDARRLEWARSALCPPSE
jgi:hypothetical protein